MNPGQRVDSVITLIDILGEASLRLIPTTTILQTFQVQSNAPSKSGDHRALSADQPRNGGYHKRLSKDTLMVCLYNCLPL